MHANIWSIFAILAVLIQVIPAAVVLYLASATDRQEWFC